MHVLNVKKAHEIEGDFGDIPDTHWYYNPSSRKLLSYSKVQWDKLIARQKVVLLRITELLKPEQLNIFVMNTGLVNFVLHKKGRNMPEHLSVIGASNLDHFFCKK